MNFIEIVNKFAVWPQGWTMVAIFCIFLSLQILVSNKIKDDLKKI